MEHCREQAARRRAGGQRHVLYLGEINASQELAWRKSIDVFEDGAKAPRTLALFPEDRCEGVVPDEAVVPGGGLGIASANWSQYRFASASNSGVNAGAA